MCRTATKFPGAFASKYWNSLLLQANSTASAILHAMLALSSAHQEVVLDAHRRPLPDTGRQEFLTVRQYSKAIRYLQPHFSDQSRTSVCVTLIACIVFVTLEFWRGNYTIDMKHLQHGLNLPQESHRVIGLKTGNSAQSMLYLDDQIVTLVSSSSGDCSVPLDRQYEKKCHSEGKKASRDQERPLPQTGPTGSWTLVAGLIGCEL